MPSKNTSSFFVRALLREEKRVGQDHTLILSLLLAPLFYAFFYGSIYLNKTEQEVKIAVIDNDRTELSRQFVRMVDETQSVKLDFQAPSIGEAKTKFLNSEIQGILVIEKDFERQLKRLQSADVGLLLNTSRFLPSNDINETVTEIALLIGAGVRLQYYEMHGNSDELSMAQAMPLMISDHTIFVNPVSYGGFLLPGLLLLILQQTFLIGLAESTAREREQKTVKNWLALGKDNIWSAILGKGIFFLLLYAAYTLFFHVVNYHVLNIPLNGNAWILSGLFLIFYSVLVCFGIFFGSLFKKEIHALQFFAFSSYPIFLLSGYSWPLYAMNNVLQFLAALIPTTPMLEAYGAIVFKGASMYQVIPSIIHLLILLVLYAGLAHFALKSVQHRLETT